MLPHRQRGRHAAEFGKLAVGMTAPTTSIVVCTRGRPNLLAQALTAIARLRHAQFELLVVHDPEEHKVVELLSSRGASIRALESREENLARSRNIGLDHARGDIIAFMDDDAVPHPLWLHALLRAFANPEIGAAGGYTIGPGGREFQARRTVCDRYGSSFQVDEFLNIDAIGRRGDWIYPAPLGTNIAFRRSALLSIGGFDEAFSYYLEETDACLRLVDANWRVTFEPGALVWHGLAESTLRTSAQVPRSYYKIAFSKGYFVSRHGVGSGAPKELVAATAHLAEFQTQKCDEIIGLRKSGIIEESTSQRLRAEIEKGLSDGWQAGASGTTARSETQANAGEEFMPYRQGRATRDELRVAFVCRAFGERVNSGIARWTEQAALALAERGHTVHVLKEAKPGGALTIFENGIWRHELELVTDDWQDLSAIHSVAEPLAKWAASVRSYLPALRAFGVNCISAPIWDVEGLACLEEKDMPLAVSLHTISSVEAPQTVSGIEKAERSVLRQARLILANSARVLQDIQHALNVDVTGKSVVIPHGTPIPATMSRKIRGACLKVIFVGRAEPRKGIDVAIDAVHLAIQTGCALTAKFVMHPISGEVRSRLGQYLESGRVSILGPLSRSKLDEELAEADVLIVPSRYESFGLVAIEAFAQGTPVVATDVGGLSEIVEPGINGILVPPCHGAKDIAEVLIRLAGNRPLLDALSQGAFKSATEKFTRDKMGQRLEAELQKLAGVA